jgi:hypothetical protein
MQKPNSLGQPTLWSFALPTVQTFALRREPLYHKLQYSKAPKFDPSAAVLGVALGAFSVYLSLNTVGSMGVDLTDLTVLG